MLCRWSGASRCSRGSCLDLTTALGMNSYLPPTVSWSLDRPANLDGSNSYLSCTTIRPLQLCMWQATYAQCLSYTLPASTVRRLPSTTTTNFHQVMSRCAAASSHNLISLHRQSSDFISSVSREFQRGGVSGYVPRHNKFEMSFVVGLQ